MKTPETGASFEDRKLYFFLVLGCLLAYANSLSGAFLFDDTAQIVSNSAIRSWQNLVSAFTTDVWAFERGTDSTTIPPPYYRPLFTVYLTVGFQLFGLWEQGWHLLNLAVHTGATVLAFRLFLLLGGGNRRLAFVGAMLFALTPIHVESISWISGIPDPLAALFYIPAMIYYVRWRQSEAGDKKYLLLSLLFFFLALLCKETPIVLPAVLFVWEMTMNRKSGNNFVAALKPVLLFIVPAAIYLAMRVAVLGKLSWKHPYITDTPTELIYATIPVVAVTYLKNIIFPYRLSLFYNTRFVTGFDDWQFWLPVLILAAIGCAVFFLRCRITPLMWVAGALFVIPILPVFNLQVFHYQYIVQDRYLYLPSLGFVLLVGCLLEKLWQSERKNLQTAATAIAAILFLLYAAGTIWQNRVWHSAVNLWTRAAEIKPDSWMSHYNLGLAQYQNKNYPEAIRNFDAALNSNPYRREDDLIYNNRGLAKRDAGQPLEAKNDFLKSLQANPNRLETNVNLGAMLFDEKNYPEAEKQFRKAVQIKPADVSANFNLARTLARINRHAEAAKIYEKLLQTEKSDAELMYYAAVSYAANGQTEPAKILLTNAAALASDETLKKLIADERQKLK